MLPWAKRRESLRWDKSCNRGLLQCRAAGKGMTHGFFVCGSPAGEKGKIARETFIEYSYV
jgi:hypothetical protein